MFAKPWVFFYFLLLSECWFQFLFDMQWSYNKADSKLWSGIFPLLVALKRSLMRFSCVLSCFRVDILSDWEFQLGFFHPWMRSRFVVGGVANWKMFLTNCLAYFQLSKFLLNLCSQTICSYGAPKGHLIVFCRAHDILSCVQHNWVS